MKPHSFDPLVAKEMGIECAILLYNIEFWIEKNKANNKHFYEGKYWTYNSTKAFAEQFPYMSERVIYKTLQKLIEKGYIIKGNFNKNTFDRTCWYALGEKIDITTGENANYQMEESILPNGKIDITTGENDINVSDINTNENLANINTDLFEAMRQGFNQFKAMFNQVKPIRDLGWQNAEQEFYRAVRSKQATQEEILTALSKQVEIWKHRLSAKPSDIQYIPRPENWLSKKDYCQDFDKLLEPYKSKGNQQARGGVGYGDPQAQDGYLIDILKK